MHKQTHTTHTQHAHTRTRNTTSRCLCILRPEHFCLHAGASTSQSSRQGACFRLLPMAQAPPWFSMLLIVWCPSLTASYTVGLMNKILTNFKPACSPSLLSLLTFSCERPFCSRLPHNSDSLDQKKRNIELTSLECCHPAFVP